MERVDSQVNGPVELNGIVDRHQFADELNRLREAAGLSVRDLARQTGIPHSTLGGYLTGRHLPPVNQPEFLLDVLHACGIDEPTTIEQWTLALGRVRRVPGPRPSGAPSPYRGLASYQPDDAEWFFGRRELTLTVVERLAERWADGGDIITLVGPSGSGKSSLLRAGVIPALRTGRLAGAATATWPVMLMHPGPRPLHALATHLSRGTGHSPDLVADDLRADPDRCAQLARRAAANGGDGVGLVIVVDQFEEFFTECEDDAERQHFLCALRAAATAPTGADDSLPGRPPAVVLLALRADFYHRALREPQLVTALQRSQIAIGPMNEAELREAIIAPARKAGLEVEDGLVELLLRDLSPPDDGSGRAAREGGRLPLLSHALRATWERGTRRRLTVADYEAVGGVRGAVARTADAVYDSLTPAQQEVARDLFIRLVRVGQDAPNTRQRVPPHELTTLADRAHQPVLSEVLDRFVDERLITVDEDAVEIAHDALVAAWPRLRGWIAANRSALLVAQRLDDDARQWRRDGRDPALLYQGARLAAVQGSVNSAAAHQLSPLGLEFLRVSTGRERRRTRRLYQTIGTLAALLLLAITIGAYAVEQRSVAVAERAEAARERNEALSRMVAVRADRLRATEPTLAGQLALAAYRIDDTVEARSSLLSIAGAPLNTRMLGPSAIIQDVAFQPRHSLFAAVSDHDGGAQLWDVTDRHLPTTLTDGLPGLDGTLTAVALSPDGRILAVGGAERNVHLYDLADPTDPVEAAILTSADGPVSAVAFSPHRPVLAAATQGGGVHLWDIATADAPSPLGDPLQPGAQPLLAVAFSPNDRTMVAAGLDAMVHRWNITDLATPIPLGDDLVGPDREVSDVAFSPDGTLVAAASANETVHLWRVGDPSTEPVATLAAPSGSGRVHAVEFSPDGQMVAAGSEDGVARLWDLGTGRVTLTLPHNGAVTGLAFDRDGQAVYTAAAGAVRRWQLPGPVIGAPAGAVRGLVHHPDAPILVAASTDGRLYLWDVADRQRPELLSSDPVGPEGSAMTGRLAISPDGLSVAAVSHHGAVLRWDISDPRRPVLLDPMLVGLENAPDALAFSPDGQVLAAGGPDGVVLWDLSDPQRPGPMTTVPEVTGAVHAVAFHPQGRVLAAAGTDRVAWLWDLTDPEAPRPVGSPIAGLAKPIDAVAFSPDGATLAVADAGHTVSLFDITDHGHFWTRSVLNDPNSQISDLSFSPDGRQLAAAARDHTVMLWDLTGGTPLLYAVLAGPERGVNAVAYGPDARTLAIGSSDTTVRLLPTDPAEAAALICAVRGMPVTPQEWSRHVPGHPYDPPC